MKIFCVRFVFLVSYLAVISTVFITNDSFFHGFITAKYFWFASVMCVVSLFIPFRISWKNEIRLTDILFGLLFVYVCANYFLLNGRSNMHWWLTLLMAPLYIAIRTVAKDEKLRHWLIITVLIVTLTESLWGLLQLYGFVKSHHALYRITGTFFNPGPYSGFLSMGVPFALYFSLNKTLQRWERSLGMISLAAVLLVFPAAMSRAAWIAAAAGCLPVIIQNSKFKIQNFNLFPVTIRILITTAVCLLLAGTYLMKKDSANGRIVVWSASLEAIKKRPLFGAGYGRFAAVYGDAQTAYFNNHERSPAQILIADSPEYAFNEYVQVAVELGIVGLLLFLAMIGSVFRLSDFRFLNKPPTLSAALQPDRFSNCKDYPYITASFIAFLVFAVFSYPFSILPLAIMFVFLLALSAPASKKLSPSMPVCLQVVGIAVCFGITAFGVYNILPKCTAYREWTMLNNSDAEQRTVGQYAALYPHLRHEKIFLFDYGQSLSRASKHAESNRLFEEYLCYGSDPMAYNCMGLNFKEMGEYSKAENMYLCAFQIVPNRHYPLYLLMILYNETGQTEKAKAMANVLLKKPVKVQSEAIREIREEAAKIVND